MRKKQTDVLKYTANSIGVSVAAYFTASYLLKAVFSLLITFFHKSATLQSPVGVPEWVMGCANLAIAQGSLIIAIVILKSLVVQGHMPPINIKPHKSRKVWLFLPVFLGGGIVTNIINSLFSGFCTSVFKYEPRPAVTLPSSTPALLLYFVSLCVAPAILEEILVRGFFQGLLTRWGPWFGILTSSVIFTLMHSDFTQMPGIFLLSVMLGVVAYTTSSLLPGIVLHFANNCVAFLLAWTQQNADSAALRAFSAYIIVMIVVTAVLCAGVIFKGKFYRGFEPIPHMKDPKNRQSRIERLITSPCFVIVILTLAVKAVFRF